MSVKGVLGQEGAAPPRRTLDAGKRGRGGQE